MSNEGIAMIENARMEEWPSVIACSIWITKTSSARDMSTIAELQKQLMTLRLKSNEDPNKLAEKVATLIRRCKCAVNQEHYIAVVVNTVGRMYKLVIAKAFICKMHEK